MPITKIKTTGVTTGAITSPLVAASQSNITSVGTLTSLTVSGNTTVGNIIGPHANGNSNINIPAANGNVNISAAGNSNILIITGTGANITGTANITGNANLAVTNFVKYAEKVISGGNTGAATLTPDAAAGTIYQYTLTGNITLNTLANAVSGTSMTLVLTQDATGNRLLTSTMKFSGNSKTLSTAANSIDVLCVFYDGTTYYASLSKGYA